MNHTLIGLAIVAAMIGGTAAFAADAPPAAVPAPAESPMPAAPAPAAEPPAVAPAPVAAAAPAEVKAPVHVSACTRDIRKAERALETSKSSPDAVADAWQHIKAAKMARTSHDQAACKSEATTAAQML